MRRIVRPAICSTMLAAALATAAGFAQAETWAYNYRGFYDPGTATFLPDYILTGSFTGEDGNGDGVIALDELTGFATDGVDFFGDSCTLLSSFSCTVNAFSYRLTGELSYSTEWTFQDEGISQSTVTVTGDRHTVFIAPVDREPFSQQLLWTGATTFSITPPPIPEPSMAATTIAGLLLAAAGRWRRCRRSRVSSAAAVR